jgi:23S rRNA (adenine2503-C2)-methyltransferase
MPPLPLITNLNREELSAVFTSMGQPAYRTKQVWQWLYQKRVPAWGLMLNLPASLRTELEQAYRVRGVHTERIEGASGDTQKILARLGDDECVETVLIPSDRFRTVCVSSQVGCSFACAFCASGQSGFRRNLEPGEIISQVLLAADTYGDKPSHVVFMGMGEPFDNYDAVMKAVRLLNDHDGLDIGARRITLSTSGVIPGIRALAAEGIQVELSVSLHAPTEDLRSKLMPVNRQYPLAELIPACRDYAAQTGRVITFEYTMIQSLNDSTAMARSLAELIGPFPSRVNLIPLSPVAEFDGTASSPQAIEAFMDVLTRSRINVTLRQSKGTSLQAACGQLRCHSMRAEGPA